MVAVIARDRDTPCEECPFRPGGYHGKMNRRSLAKLTPETTFPCHMTYGYFNEEHIFVRVDKDKEQPFQRCAGHLLFCQKTGRGHRLCREDKAQLHRLIDPGVYSSEDEMHFREDDLVGR